MQNIKPLQTNKPKIMSNKEAMEELERYNPPKEEPKETKPQTINEEINKEVVPYKNFKIPKQEKEAIKGLETLLGEEPFIVNKPEYDNKFEISIKDNKIVYLRTAHLNLKRIPEQINKLTNLQILYLNKNQIQEIEGLDNLTNLQELHLGYNQIQKIKGLDNLTKLKELYLSDNPIKNKEQIYVLAKKGVKVHI